MQPQTLKNAPLTEAMIDIHVDPTDGAADRLAQLASELKDRYPDASPQWELSFQATVVDGKPSVDQAPQQRGLILRTADKRQALQVKASRFALSRLKPYETWEKLRDEARSVWRLYSDVLKPRAATRVAVRYINRLEIPPGIDMKQFVLTVPEIAPDLPQQLSGLFMQLQMPRPDAVMVVLTQAFEPPTDEKNGGVTLLFDIDASKVLFFGEDVDFWPVLEMLRQVKNEVFFKSFTNEALERYR
jgi:uncharacterized protein (TIGR04255 family)